MLNTKERINILKLVVFDKLEKSVEKNNPKDAERYADILSKLASMRVEIEDKES